MLKSQILENLRYTGQATLNSFLFEGMSSKLQSTGQSRSGRRVTRWKRWMNECLEYISMNQGQTYGVHLQQIRRYMLKEFGVPFFKTTNLLRDLDSIGQIAESSGKIVLQTREDDDS